MLGGTFKYLYNKSAFYISGLRQAAGIGAIRRMIMPKKRGMSGKHDQSRAGKDRTDSLRILEERFTRGDVIESEYEIMKSVLVGKGDTDKHHSLENR